MQSLVFFNKEGDNYNFRWLAGDERWEGNLIFHENGNDTFKTIGIYLFERIEAFEYENPGVLKLQKFQLFNEYRFNYTGSPYSEEEVIKIEPVNTDPTFFSKWVYGKDFEKKFPIGSQVYFENPIFEFSTSNLSYTVIQTKKNAILIITSVDNRRFLSLYGSQIGLTSSYVNIKISGLNSIGVYNYVDQQLNTLLSDWSEPDFYDRYFNGRKINLINTEKNDGVYTVNNIDVYDKAYSRYQLSIDQFTQSQNLAVELILKTDLPVAYTGGLSIDGNRLNFDRTIPIILKPGTEIVIAQSTQNPNPVKLEPIPNYRGLSNETFFATGSQIIWENRIYETIQSFTWSPDSSNYNQFNLPTPDNTSLWGEPTYLLVDRPLVNETFVSTEIHLTTNKLYFVQNFTQSSLVTMGSLVESYAADFSFFKVDFYIKESTLYADLIYPSPYAYVNYYLFTQSITSNFGTISNGTSKIIYEQNVGVTEVLKPEVNKDICENFSYNIVFTDLDEYGLNIRINGQEYQEQIDFIYVGITPDLTRTIDRTLRNWIAEHYTELVSVGIFAKLQYIGGASSIYHNSINFTTEYPNVPFQFDVKVGSTADFYIEHSDVIFYDMSNYLNLTINGRSYGQAVTVTGATANIVEALENWVNEYSDELIDWGIFVSNVNQKLEFRVKKQNQRLDYTISVGKSSLPGIDLFKIDRKMFGKFGALMTSNAIILPEGSTSSFEDYPFATGQIVAINNTVWPYDNQEYNILYLGSNHLVLSYQGPFWGTTDPRCDVSPYVSIAFNTGFGATGCTPVIVPTASIGGNFNLQQFTHSFSINNFFLDTYSFSNYILPGNSNIVDIIYLRISSAMYVLGSAISVIDASTSMLIKTITLTGLSFLTAKSFKWNNYNSYLYCLSSNRIYIVDPVLNDVVYSFTLSGNANSIEVGDSNGDVFVTYDNAQIVDIWYFNNFTSVPSKTINLSGFGKGLVYNPSENDIYLSQDNGNLLRIDLTARTVFATYSITGLNPELFYDSINSSVYYFDSIGLKNINNGVTVPVFSGTSSFKSLVYNHNSGVIVVSQNDLLSQISLSNTVINSFNLTNYGNLAVSYYDENTYLPSLTNPLVFILDKQNSNVVRPITVNSIVSKLIFDPERNTMFGIQPGTNTLIEISVVLGEYYQQLLATFSTIFDNQLGTLDPNYRPHPDVWLSTRDYLRKPRENYNDEPFVKYVWKWETDQYPQMFLFDFSGDQLPITGSYAYTGEKPLDIISLNRNPNKDINKVSLPEFQQTIFSEVITELVHVDSETDFTFVPEPLQTFIGFRSDDEGVLTSNLILIKREEISFTITPTILNNDSIEFRLIRSTNNDYGSIRLNTLSTSLFTFDENNVPRGLKAGQIIKVTTRDLTNIRNKYLSKNHGRNFKILRVSSRELLVQMIDVIVDEKNIIEDYPKVNQKTYLSVTIEVLDKTIGRFVVAGQTEIEDIRYKIELSNVGHNIDPEDVYIFKPYDINEQGIDWTYMNKKRKELMMVRHDIFPYVGSYKAIINAINFFGYNDLELYEYYRNVDIRSADYLKLFKVEIPDIFDNSVPGWKSNDFIKHTLPNLFFETTNLFNLTYNITDKEGNNVLLYSLAEVIIKLQGLKFWLQRKVIPITHKILDITGRADWTNTTGITHRNYDVKILNVRQSMTPIDFVLSEAYLMPVNSGSTVYTCVVDFYYAEENELPDCFDITIRTYKTYKEWNPFTTYTIGEKVFYYDNIWESKINKNRLKNPRKYENAPLWTIETNYLLGQFVKYDEYIYQYVGTISSFSQSGTSSNLYTPLADILTNGSFASWIDNTEWRKIEIEPVQTLKEWRNDLDSFNFTIDSNIDPFIVIEVTSDNGYGQIYTQKKNYEIRGLNDLFTGYEGEKIEPFSPIVQLTGPLVPRPTSTPTTSPNSPSLPFTSTL